MRIIIHGAGAVGSLVGGWLADSGVEVALIARDAHAETVNRQGLQIKSAKGDRVVNLPAVTSPHQITPRIDDVVILTVKSSQTAASVQSLREVFPEDTPVFCLQNGVRNEELAARRFLTVYGAMAGMSVTMISPGVISHTLNNVISIGNYPMGCDELGLEVAELLTKAGFRVTTHESIMAIKWSKLILNLHNATFSILDKHLQFGLASPAISRFMADVEEEGLHVLDIAGISLADAKNPIDFTKRLDELRNKTEDPEKLFESENMPTELRTYPSTWTDLKLKRGETEASFFNGEIILLGEKYGVPTPYNSTLLNIVETMAADGLNPGLYSIEELIDQVEQRRLMIYNS
ncbi:MAG: 2-dehydropantoate 2-reductase [Acidobacteriota bacterium]|nr:2-dehydropantoate 2-reductase [Acidobacteriota bacterium]